MPGGKPLNEPINQKANEKTNKKARAKAGFGAAAQTRALKGDAIASPAKRFNRY
ncbi:hypothetical protein [Paraburkholderia bryophila]|uniref:Uncharacterized protein n=1 Tax=Paraburkholderia bryophila TaxID=420952 RepID=A0A7Y9WP47_9BURK|nr:hypothetical protein [Paraburkholderia bryophila]NYH24461.1 hypothetical protein [Paraburkholderia bryophila]